MTTKEYNQTVRRCGDDVYRFAARLCGDAERGKDVTQEAFIALHLRREEVPTGKAKAFLMTAAYHKAMDLWRSEFSEQTRIQALRPEEAYSPAEQYDMGDAVERALQLLPQSQRAALVLRDVQGYSYREIADITSLTEQQVRVYLFRARSFMKQKLTEYGYDYQR